MERVIDVSCLPIFLSLVYQADRFSGLTFPRKVISDHRLPFG